MCLSQCSSEIIAQRKLHFCNCDKHNLAMRRAVQEDLTFLSGLFVAAGICLHSIEAGIEKRVGVRGVVVDSETQSLVFTPDGECASIHDIFEHLETKKHLWS